MTTNKIPFQQVDVFTKIPFKGNPVAVILDGNNLSTEEMQDIANWIHLSETTFVCYPTDPIADYRLRIFSPQNELPFAGHPTIGSAYAVLKHGLRPQNKDYLVQECTSGLIKIYRQSKNLFLTLPKAQKTSLSAHKIKLISQALGINKNDIKLSKIINVGAVWYTLQLKNAQQILNVKPNINQMTQVIDKGITGITIFGEYPRGSETNFEARSFAPNEGANEDPVCGSGNGCIAVLVKDNHLVDQEYYTVSQGTCLGRSGRVQVHIPNGNNPILIGGQAITCITGNISI